MCYEWFGALKRENKYTHKHTKKCGCVDERQPARRFKCVAINLFKTKKLHTSTYIDSAAFAIYFRCFDDDDEKKYAVHNAQSRCNNKSADQHAMCFFFAEIRANQKPLFSFCTLIKHTISLNHIRHTHTHKHLLSASLSPNERCNNITYRFEPRGVFGIAIASNKSTLNMNHNARQTSFERIVNMKTLTRSANNSCYLIVQINARAI